MLPGLLTPEGIIRAPAAAEVLRSKAVAVVLRLPSAALKPAILDTAQNLLFPWMYLPILLPIVRGYHFFTDRSDDPVCPIARINPPPGKRREFLAESH